MEYIMKSGNLFLNDTLLVRIKSTFAGSEKKIFAADGELLMLTDICNLKAPLNERGNIRYRQYAMLDRNGKECVVAKPDYAESDDPAVVGWPICRMPRVDHAQICIGKKEYLLSMQNSQNYFLSEKQGKTVVQITHRGLCGGWDIDAADDFAPEIICAIFVFCRYIEQENEFLVV